MPLKRREFLKGVGSLAAVPALTLAQGRKPIVGVVGGGIVGASVALHLAEAGAQVTVFERTAPGAGATSKSFAWINAFTNDPHYRALRLKSISAYHDLQHRAGLNITWGGAVHWAMTLAEAERMKADVAEFSQAGYDARIIDADRLAGLSPNVRLGQFRTAMINSPDGHVDPVHATERLLATAKLQGAEIVHPCEVRELRVRGQRLTGVSTSTGDYSLDRLVIAGGVDTPVLATQAGYDLSLLHAPGILLHTRPLSPVVGRVFESPDMYFKQNPDGRIVGNDASYAPDIPVHEGILEGPADMPEEIRRMHGERILAKIREKVPAAGDADYDHLTLGYRPMPEDRLPVVGFSPGNPNVYISVMHSGVTLAAIMGRYISYEIMQDDPIDELAPYRPDRFVRASH